MAHYEVVQKVRKAIVDIGGTITEEFVFKYIRSTVSFYKYRFKIDMSQK